MLTEPGDTEWEGYIQALLNVPQAIDRFREIRYWPLIDASWVYSAREAELLSRYGIQVDGRMYIQSS